MGVTNNQGQRENPENLGNLKANVRWEYHEVPGGSVSGEFSKYFTEDALVVNRGQAILVGPVMEDEFAGIIFCGSNGSEEEYREGAVRVIKAHGESFSNTASDASAISDIKLFVEITFHNRITPTQISNIKVYSDNPSTIINGFYLGILG